LALILNIDTATELASVCLADNERLLSYRENEQQKEHASFVHLAIKQIMEETSKELSEVDAIAVTSGPGSYTGLRVGLATAKGLCFALNKPLITVGTLEVMTQAAITGVDEKGWEVLYCPMLDARRMEVFTAIFNAKLEAVLPPQALVLNEESFKEFAAEKKIVFFGNGSNKLEKIVSYNKAIFAEVKANAKDLNVLAQKAFIQGDFANVAYSAPNYLKEFHSTQQS
jgi:tRNA threonylcarbamoyladenosine biosynthesis protein TsaB